MITSILIALMLENYIKKYPLNQRVSCGVIA